MEINKELETFHKISAPGDNRRHSKKDIPMEFERLFARQLVHELTRGLFDNNKEVLMPGSGNLYKEQIIDVLSNELAKQNKLGIANTVEEYLSRQKAGGSSQ